MVILTTQLIRKDYIFSIDWLFIIRNAVAIFLLSTALWYSQGIFYWGQDINRFVRVGYLVVLVGTYACILLGFNYRSIITLWKETKHLQTSKS